MSITAWKPGVDRGRGARRLGLLGLFALVLGLLAAPAWAALGDYRCNDPGRVYYGNPRLIRNPAVASADRVFAYIDEYQQILREGLTEQDVRYHFLMKEASKRFAEAVRAAARAGGYDFVAEEGSVEVAKPEAPEPPDLTNEVIQSLGG